MLAVVAARGIPHAGHKKQVANLIGPDEDTATL